MASGCACICMQVKTMESGLYIQKSGSITPRSIQGNALKPSADAPASSGREFVGYKIQHIARLIAL